MTCENHFADALAGEAEGCPTCSDLLTASRRLAARLDRLPRRQAPPAIWDGLAGSLAAARRRTRSAWLGGILTGLAAAALLLVLLQPLLWQAAAPAPIKVAGPAEPSPAALPELRQLQQEADGLLLLAGLEH